MQDADAALARLCDPQAEVSSHYLIDTAGAVTQLVAEKRRAWHAGTGHWAGQADINSRSIGIELDNRGDHPFPEPQMVALERLLRAIRGRWPIVQTLGHSDMAPGRKVDPGPHFDWARLARQGLAAPLVQLGGETVSEASFRAAAGQAGFPANVPFETLLHSARLRCAPWRQGPLTADDYWLPSPT